MSMYVIIESRDPFESRDANFVVDTAIALKMRGRDVTVFLVQNGVLGARRKARASHVRQLLEAGITVQVDDFSLRERGIGMAELDSVIEQSSIESLVEVLAQETTKAFWH